jgi:uncharacterized protein (DUF488 family)
MGAVRTFGHGTASEEEIVGLLRGAGVELVVDVRTAPGSRRNPHVSRASLESRLPSYGLAYRWDKRLGGFRRPPPDSPDVFWRQEMFRGYAAHMRTPEFTEAIDELLTFSGAQAVMCSEFTVEHLMHDGRLVRHEPTPGARLRDDGSLVYDGGQEPLL